MGEMLRGYLRAVALSSLAGSLAYPVLSFLPQLFVKGVDGVLSMLWIAMFIFVSAVWPATCIILPCLTSILKAGGILKPLPFCISALVCAYLYTWLWVLLFASGSSGMAYFGLLLGPVTVIAWWLALPKNWKNQPKNVTS